ncbi:MAG TPA: PHB depolymerase family esterase [Dehalococcoidia bacterium]|nr:PHB depolymerase family esterase [Dehalococcoidia bacterium]
MRYVLLLACTLAILILLTGCGRARERHENREAARTQEAASAPAPTADAADVPTQGPSPAASGSAGCGTEAPSGSSVASIESDGVERSYRLYVPTAYDTRRPTPLVLNFHGLGATALEQERYSGFIEVAEENGFVLVSPQATGTPSEWYLYGPLERGYVDDFAFVGRLIDELSARLCVDSRRVYATGISNGGGMTSLLGCELSDRIAAIAPVAGSPYVERRCDGARPMPVIAFHGTDDPLVPFEAGPDFGDLDIFRFGARNNMRDWAQHNGCDLTLHSERIASDVVLESYGGCSNGADVQLYVIEGGGHTWPGAGVEVNALGKTTHSIDASELIWSFFATHPR